MTAAEIRAKQFDLPSHAAPLPALVQMTTLEILQEIAAQLADLNEKLDHVIGQGCIEVNCGDSR